MCYSLRYNYKKIGERIKQIRKEHKLSHKDSLEKLQISMNRRRLSEIEKGNDMYFSFDFLLKFSEYFNCDIGYILCEYDEKRQETHQICSVTGLSEKAVENLTENKNNADMQYISFLLEYGFLRGFFDEFSLYVNSDKITVPKNNTELSEILFDSDDKKLGDYIENEDNFTNHINLRCGYPLQLRSSFDTGIFEKSVVLEMQDRLRMIKEDIKKAIKDGEE